MSPRRLSSLSLNQKLTLLIAFLAIVGTIIAAFVSGHDWFQPLSSLPVLSISPTPFSGKIEFVSVESPDTLNPNLQWDAGSSELSAYSLDGDEIVVTAGPHTWPNFPMINYTQPVIGDFSIQVKVAFVPDALVLKTAQMVGLLIRPANARLVQSDTSFPKDWVVSSKYVTDAGVLVGCRGSWADYSSEIVFLKIEKGAASWKCAYSNDGEHWFYLNVDVDNTQLQNQQLAISLFAYSDTDKVVTAKFSDLEIYINGK